MFFLSGVARYLFVPLAEAVVFAMLASYVLSRTLVPTLAMYLLRAKARSRAGPRNPFVRFQRAFERGFERVRASYQAMLTTLVYRRRFFVPLFLLICVAARSLLMPWLGQDFFPSTDSGPIQAACARQDRHAHRGDRAPVRPGGQPPSAANIPPAELDTILDNIGLPYSSINSSYSNSGADRTGDADIWCRSSRTTAPRDDYVRELRQKLPREFPGTDFYFLPADIVTPDSEFRPARSDRYSD